MKPVGRHGSPSELGGILTEGEEKRQHAAGFFGA